MKRNRTKDPGERILLWGTVAILLAYSCHYLYQKDWSTITEKEEKLEKKLSYFDYGTITNNTYCNDLFGFRIHIPDDHQPFYKKYKYFKNNENKKDSILNGPKLAARVKEHDLLIIEPKFIEKNPVEMGTEEISTYLKLKTQQERFGPEYQMAIRIHHLSETSLESYTNKFQNLHNPNYGNRQMKTISGVEFIELHGIEQHGDDSPGRVMFRMLGGKNRHIISLFTVIHNYAFSIDLFYQTEEQKYTLLKILDTLEFHD